MNSKKQFRYCNNRKILRLLVFESIPRLHLASLPTPLEPAYALAAHTGISAFYIKRDDLTGLAMGGNKARKLEFDLAEVVRGGYDTIITIGGVQSNHARMTAAAGRKLGLDVKLVLGGNDFEEYKGNMLLNALLGADIRYIVGSDEDEDLEALMRQWAEELVQEGKKPYMLPIGGSTPLGALGYVQAMQELRAQLTEDHIQIVLPVGSCGTYAGTVLGARLFLPQSKVFGISISRTKTNIVERTLDLIQKSSELLGVNVGLTEKDLTVFDTYHEGYAVPVQSAQSALYTAARQEGLLLDPIYTGKAMAGLFDLVEKGIIKKQYPVVFLHTGGLPILFSKHIPEHAYKKCKKYQLEDIK